MYCSMCGREIPPGKEKCPICFPEEKPPIANNRTAVPWKLTPTLPGLTSGAKALIWILLLSDCIVFLADFTYFSESVPIALLLIAISGVGIAGAMVLLRKKSIWILYDVCWSAC